MSRLPIPGQDDGTWGDILNAFLFVAHNADGSLKDSSISTAKLQDDSVTNLKLSTGVGINGQVLTKDNTTMGGFKWATSPTGVTDHGDLSGLADDDHPQYLNQTRGDARYYTQAQIDTALTGKENTIAADITSQYYRGDKTWQTLNKAAVGLSNVDNTADTAKPVSIAQQAALDLKSNLASPTFTGTITTPGLKVTGGTLASGKVLTSDSGGTATWQELPSSAGVTNLAAGRDATNVTITSDTGTDATIPAADGSNAGVMTSAMQVKLAGIAAGAQVNTVTSVATRTGDVVLTKSDVGLSNVDNTSDANKPVSTATQTALNLKANLASPTFSGHVTVPTPTSPSDAVTKTYADALAGATNLTTAAAPTTVTINSDTGTDAVIAAADATNAGLFLPAEKTKLTGVEAGAQVNTVISVASKTGAVSLVKGDVGLGNVDNTSDVNKPVSTAQATADNLRVLKAGDTMTGGLAIGKAITSGVSALTDGATIATDASLGNIFTVTIAGNRIMGNPTNAVDGQKLIYRIKQDTTGSRTLIWDTNFRFPNAIAPTLTTTASKTDYFGFIYNGTDTKWDQVAFTGNL